MDAMCCTLSTAVEGTDAAKEATAQSALTSHSMGGSLSARTMHSMVEDGETALLMAFEEIGQGQLFPAAEAQEIRDLADGRNRSRGQNVRRKRLEKGWLILKRARAADHERAQVVCELGTDQPGTDQPGIEQPATEQSAIAQSAAEQPTVQQPIVEQPAVDSAEASGYDSDYSDLSDGEVVQWVIHDRIAEVVGSAKS